MRYLGLDLGTRTLGISLSDTPLTIATPYTVLRFNDGCYEDTFPDIKKIVDEYGIKKIILGFPKNMNNTVGDRGTTTILYKEKLEKYLNLEVVLQDERLSTVEATHYMIQADISRKKRKKKIDSLAANIILQTYLDKEKGLKK